MKPNSNWVITNTEDSNLNVVNNGNFTSYETDDVVVAVLNDSEPDPVDVKLGHGSTLRKRKKMDSSSSQNTEEVNVKQCRLEDQDDLDSPDDYVESLDAGSGTARESFSEQNENQNGCRTEVFRMEDNKYILLLPADEKFTFRGKLQLTLLSGEIEVFGYRLNHYSFYKTLDLYSPRRNMQLYVVGKQPYESLTIPELEAFLQDKLSEGDLRQLLKSFTILDSLLIIEKLNSVYSPILRHYCDEVDLFYEKEIMQQVSPVARDLECLLDLTISTDRKLFTEGYNWRRIQPQKCTVICGGKGVGKSTLLKYLINTQLMRNQSVLCLDFDPGQTEFTAPGSVSAVLVKDPLFGPNFTHSIKPEKMAFLGYVNVALNPLKYIKSVNYIIQSCREDPDLSTIPWFVNTMGFNKGIGFDIMVNVLRLLQPDVVIEICSSDRSKNYKILLEPNNVENEAVISFVPIENNVLNYRYYSLNTCARSKGIGFQGGFKPAELRDFMTLSYFSPLVSFPYNSLNAAQPFWLPFSKLTLAVNDPVEPEYILQAFNGSLVGLCNLDGIECESSMVAEDSEISSLRVVIKPEIAPCFGLGIVRGIDCSEKKIYILTPLSESDLENVNCLNLGSMSPPSCLFLKQRFLDEPGVYTDMCGSRNVQTMKRTFKG
ncbi:UNVERIFIED_CONTAM: hypothetical protein PYX00_000678 [Menopon gallinae]|uniref:Polynucleotide 5'-hydroxyl-kinase NOL9 n=1 Tax=Menopon gallinae TaxID=328185 RepID=A0AAW2IBH3_9NEOP